MTKEKDEIPTPTAPVEAEAPLDPASVPAEQSGWDRIMEILRSPNSWRNGQISEFSKLIAGLTIAGGLIAAIFLSVLWFLFFASDSIDRSLERPRGSGAGDSSGGGRNDNIRDDDAFPGYVPPN